jgi:DNA-binding HxlR family transcriptional regulator
MSENKHILFCPVGDALNVFSGRWKPEILWHLKQGTLRFNQLRRAIGGVSQKMLTQQLRELERDGLVVRTQFQEIPPRVEYACTGLAKSLEPIFYALEQWRDAHAEDLGRARKKYDKKRKKK